MAHGRKVQALTQPYTWARNHVDMLSHDAHAGGSRYSQHTHIRNLGLPIRGVRCHALAGAAERGVINLGRSCEVLEVLEARGLFFYSISCVSLSKLVKGELAAQCEY